MLSRHRRQRRPLRAQPLIHLVPNIFTVMSLCAGLTAIRYGLDQRFELALALIVVAGVLDGLDGRSARLLNITSKLGAQLDSLADFLSFGVAPALLVYLWTLNQVPAVGWSLTLLFATCCALRLARFNTDLEDSKQPTWMSRFFTGMPAPAAAGCLIMPMLATFALGQAWPRSWALNALVMLVVAVLMVSRVPTFSIKMIVVRVKPQWILPTLIGVGLLAAALLTATWMTLLIVGLAYLVTLPVSIVVAYRLRRQHAHESEQADVPDPGPGQEGAPDRIVRLGPGGPPRRDAS
jgi:CDP-diacylglycerol---serine O-phosphatidyltransferase